jgi:hypothetical protein
MSGWIKTALEEASQPPAGINTQSVRDEVMDAMMAQFEMYSWDTMIDDIDHLTPEEKAWAKEHLSPTIEVLE